MCVCTHVHVCVCMCIHAWVRGLLLSLVFHTNIPWHFVLHCLEQAPLQQLQMLQSSQFVLSDLWECLLLLQKIYRWFTCWDVSYWCTRAFSWSWYRHPCITKTLTYQLRDISCLMLFFYECTCFSPSFSTSGFSSGPSILFEDWQEQISSRVVFCSFCLQNPSQIKFA